MSKKILILSVCVMYVAVIFRPLVIFFSYEANLDYYRFELCENRFNPVKKDCCKGKCQLKKDLDNSEKKTSKDYNLTKEELSDQINPKSDGSCNLNFTETEYSYNSSFSQIYLSIYTPPPRIS